jgi:hypothetical protein
MTSIAVSAVSPLVLPTPPPRASSIAFTISLQPAIGNSNNSEQEI